jgi:IS30 family transposase
VEIGETMNRSPSALSDEMKVNRVNGVYDPVKAHQKAYVRRKYAKFQGMKIQEYDDLRRYVRKALFDDQSPEAIAERITKREKHLPSISKNAIYRYIASPYGRRIEVHQWLRRRQNRSGRRPKIRQLEDRTFIDKRPQYIGNRSRVGDVEADFIVSGKSGKGILLVVVDRKLRVTFIEKILPVSIRNMEQAFLRIKRRYPELLTVTTDNDLLFAQHQRLERLLKVKIYFCHPYHSWEKGTVENANKVIRRDIPKGSDLSKYSKWFIQGIEAKLNRRFMDCLHRMTPAEALAAHRKWVKKQKWPR